MAKRNSWVDDDPRKSLPSQVVDSPSDLPTYYYEPEKRASTFPEFEHLKKPIVTVGDHPRVSTPNDLDYGHIGAFKLGSLRITNGAASPAPSLERANTMGAEEDYLTAGHSRVSAQNQRHALGQRSQSASVPQDNVKPPWITRVESPLQIVEFLEPEQHTPLKIDTRLPLPEFSLFKFTESPTKSLELAQDYQQDLALSPFSFDNSPAISPRLEATSKHMAIEDDLFAAEPTTPDGSDERAPRSFDSGYRGEDSAAEAPQQITNGAREPPMKPLAKADSGYSSNVSLRSFRGNVAPQVPAKDGPPAPPKGPVSRVSSSTYSVASSTRSDGTVREKRSLPSLPREEPPHPLRSSPAAPLKHSSVDNLRRPSQDQRRFTDFYLPTKADKKSKQRNSEGKSSYHSSSGSDVSTGSTSRWRSKTSSKSRQSMPPPRPQSLYTVQAIRSPNEQLNIPTPSPEASRRLGERVDAFPVASFPNTLAPLRRSVSKETLGTIFSVGSAEYREELTMKRLQSALPAVPTIAETPPKPDYVRRHTFQPSAPAVPTVRKPVQRQSYQPQASYEQNVALRQKLQQDFETEITSFDSVSSSLGRSPYDAAITSHTAEQRAKSMTASLEADATARFRQRQLAPEPKALEFIRRATSYESIAKQNPFDSSPSPSPTPSGSRQSGTRRPPPAHGNLNMRRISQNLGEVRGLPEREQRLQQRSSGSLRDEAGMRRESLLRIRSPPPVSMMNVGKVPSKRNSSPSPQHQAQVMNYTPPPPAPNRTPPSVPDESEPWKEQQNYWAERKQDAIKTRKSMEMQRPENARLSFEMMTGIQLRRPESTKPVQSYYGGSDNAYPGSYDHTYGSYSEGKQSEGEYYDAESEPTYVPRGVHQRNASTSEMLGLDGEMDYGYGLPTAARNAPMRNVPNYMEGGMRRVRVGS